MVFLENYQEKEAVKMLYSDSRTDENERQCYLVDSEEYMIQSEWEKQKFS